MRGFAPTGRYGIYGLVANTSMWITTKSPGGAKARAFFVMGPEVPTPDPCRALFGARYLHDLENKHRKGNHQRGNADDKGSQYFMFYMDHLL